MKKIAKVLAYTASCFIAFGMGLATGMIRSFKKNGIELPSSIDAELDEVEDFIIEKLNEGEASDDATEEVVED